ncbi:MAG: helix-turn-helix domain-containing protein [Fibrobacteres bacterium]|nr:helix-turn-helix domain-containing protein [Fibrobacterota bacterium]
MNEKFYTVEQIAELLQINEKTIQRYIREGKLKAVKLGKSWRVTGHDLSVFTESTGVGSNISSGRAHNSDMVTSASAVVDVQVADTDAAIRIMNTLTAALNSKPAEFGRSSMNTQYIQEEKKVRISLWGSVDFMAVIMDNIRLLTKQC